MGWLEGLLTGYANQQSAIQAEGHRLAEERAVRESAIYERLLSSPDPQLKAMATTGLLQLGQKRRGKGLGAWMGEMETSAIYPDLLKYASTPGYFEDPVDPLELAQQARVPPPSGAITTPPATTGSAALPTTSPTVAGQPAPTPTQAGPPPPPDMGGEAGQAAPAPAAAAPAAAPAPPGGAAGAPPVPPALAAAMGVDMPGEAAPPPSPPGTSLTPPPAPPAQTSLAPKAPPRRTRTVLRLPEVFPGPGYLAEEKAKAEVTGDIRALQEAFRQGGDPDWQQKGLQAYLAQRGRGAGSTFQAIPGETLGPDGKWRPAFGVKNGATGEIEEVLPNGQRAPFPGGFRPKASANLANLGSARNAAMLEFGYNFADLQADPGKAQQVNDRAAELTAAAAAETTAARAGAAAVADLSTPDRESKMMSLRDDWNTKSARWTRQVSAVSQMKTAYAAGLKRGDIQAAAEAVTVLWQKGIDPESVVREAEANRPAQFSGLATRVRGAWERFAGGGAAIPFDELKQYVQLADEMAQATALLLEDERARIERIATRLKIDPRDVVPGPLVAQPKVEEATTGGTGGTGGPPPPPDPNSLNFSDVLRQPAPAAPGAAPVVAPVVPAPVVTPRTPLPSGPGDISIDNRIVARDGKLIVVDKNGNPVPTPAPAPIR